MQLKELVFRIGEQGFPLFEVSRLKKARIVVDAGVTNILSETDALDAYGRIVPGEADMHGIIADDLRPFRAERYGGMGNGTNFGGVRCGFDGEFQVKGVGVNALMGKGMPEGYTHGGMALFECLQEAIWGEVLHVALPHGAVRVRAVLSTGTRCWWVTDTVPYDVLIERYGPEVHLPRGLVLRDPSIRPAHFERAYFVGGDAESVPLSLDEVARVRRVIQWLPEALPSSVGHAKATREEALAIGLLEMARRFADQAAAAVAKRLVHGSISPSNIAIDGRWLDYGSANVLPFWGQVVGYEPFWDNGVAYANIFESLCHNLVKYLDRSRIGYVIPSSAELYACYSVRYESELRQRFLGLAGIPAALTGAIEVGSASRLYKELMAIATAGQDEPYSHVDLPDVSTPYGRYRLGDCVIGMLTEVWTGDDRTFCAALTDAERRRRLLDAFGPVYRAVSIAAKEQGLHECALRRLMVMQAARGRRQVPLLFRPAMVRETERIVAEYRDPLDLREAAESLLHRLRDESTAVYAEVEGFDVPIWQCGERRLIYRAGSDAFFDCGEGLEQPHPGRAGRPSGFAAEAVQFWGDDVWRLMDAV